MMYRSFQSSVYWVQENIKTCILQLVLKIFFMPPPFSMGEVGVHIVSPLSVHTSVPSVTLGFRAISFERIGVLD